MRQFVDPEPFYDSLATGTVVIFDEIHHLEDPSRVLKIAADAYPHVKILATGSSTLAATRKFRDSLTGRKQTIYLPPVLWSECIAEFGIKDLDHRLLHGGLPEPLLETTKDEPFFSEWMDSFYARDIQELFDIRNRTGFMKLLHLLLRQSGGLLDYTNLARLSDLSRHTVKAHIEAMRIAHAVFLLPPFESGALSRDNGKVRFEHILCTDCLACADVCENGCITKIGALISADEAIDKLLRDRPFYENTNGGVTISGGEPLFQHEFVSEILSRLHKQGVHTVVDTSGFAGPEAFAGIIDNVDLFLFDIKHLDREKHQSTIGVYNDIILNNLKECAARTQVWTRTPLIPGFNDDLDITDAIVDLAREVGAQRCCFLPVHRWGEHKYSRHGLANPYEHIREFSAGELQIWKERYKGQEKFVFFEAV